MVIGPGLGLDAGPVIEALWALNVPLVVDADALNWLSEHPLPNRQAPWIGTPHPLEAHRLTGQSFDDRFIMLESLETLYEATWVLKGAGTLVTGKPTWLNPLANPVLGTAGSGDVLAGMIGSLWAQGSKTGNTPVTIAIFTNTYKKMTIANPLATSLINLFFAFRPIPVIEIMIRK